MNKTFTIEQVEWALNQAEESKAYSEVTAYDMVEEVRYWLAQILLVGGDK